MDMCVQRTLHCALRPVRGRQVIVSVKMLFVRNLLVKIKLSEVYKTLYLVYSPH